ncbi:MAG: DUF5752 family protein [Caldisericaceae bacterium]
MKPFEFWISADVIYLSNTKARNLSELLDGIKKADGATIYHHTHRYLEQHYYLSPEPPNDFAYWTSNVLLERIVGEKLAAIDIRGFYTISSLKEKLISIIQDYLAEGNELRDAPEGMEFRFMRSKSFLLKTGHSANGLEGFYEAVKKVSIHSLYYHIFESRLRIGKEDNDFSIWLRDELKEESLAEEISKLDPYTITLEGLRDKICSLIEVRLNGKT